MPPVVPNESGRLPEVSAAPAGQAREAEVRWRASRHARRLLTLALAGLLFATLTRRPELAGLAAPALLLLGVGHRVLASRLGLRAGLTASRLYEGELAAVARWVAHDGRARSRGGLAGFLWARAASRPSVTNRSRIRSTVRCPHPRASATRRSSQFGPCSR